MIFDPKPGDPVAIRGVRSRTSLRYRETGTLVELDKRMAVVKATRAVYYCRAQDLAPLSETPATRPIARRRITR